MNARACGAVRRRLAALCMRHGVAKLALAGALSVTVLGAGAVQLGDTARIVLKAHAAQWLVERAWQTNLAHGTGGTRPWQWADMTPVARLVFVRQQQNTIVFDNDAARVLAFGPGVRAGGARPGQHGNTVISGHRDTHFSVLRNIAAGDPIDIETLEGNRLSYRVTGMIVVDERDTWVANDHGIDELTLVTCWPFDASAPGGPLRLVVSAQRISAAWRGTSDSADRAARQTPHPEP